MATSIELAAEAEKKAQEELKRKKEEDAALLESYKTGSQGIYDTSKETASGLLGTSKSDIESLYGKGYSNLQNLVGQESEAAIKESLRPIEGKLAQQGLLGGPSGALNEALAGAAERVRNEGIGRLADYQGQMTGALANVYGDTARQQASLEEAFGTKSQGLLATALDQNLSNSQQGLDLSTKYGLTGLEGALGTNKLILEQQGQQDLAAQQAADQADLLANQNAAEEAARKAELETRQRAWDNNFYSLKSKLYSQYRAQGYNDLSAMTMAQATAANQAGPRPA